MAKRAAECAPIGEKPAKVACGVACNPFGGISFGAKSGPIREEPAKVACSVTSNPFSGISFGGKSGQSFAQFAPSSASGCSSFGFSTKVQNSPSTGLSSGFGSASGGFSGFASGAGAKPANGFPISASKTNQGSSANSGDSVAIGKANPFTGLSLFSTPSGGSFFTAAAATLGAEPATSTSSSSSTSKADAGPDQDKTKEDCSQESCLVVDEPGETDVATGEEDEEVLFKGDCKLWKLVRQTDEDALQPGVKSNPAVSNCDTQGAGGSAESPKTGASVDAAGASASNPASNANSDADAGGEVARLWRWQERGCGKVHINRHSKTETGRLVMRMRGVHRLLLNTPIIPTTKYESLGKKSVRFVGADLDADGVEGSSPLCAYRLSLQTGEQQAEFLSVLTDKFGVAVAS